MHTSFDMVELTHRVGADPLDVATAYWEVFDRLELLWLWDGIETGRSHARTAGRPRPAAHFATTCSVRSPVWRTVCSRRARSTPWLATNGRSVERAVQQLTQIRRADVFNITNLSVALRQLRNLVQTSVRGS